MRLVITLVIDDEETVRAYWSVAPELIEDDLRDGTLMDVAHVVGVECEDGGA